MEDPQRLPNDDPSAAGGDDAADGETAAELQRRAEEAMEQMLLAQENEEDEAGRGDDEIDDNNNNNNNNNIDGVHLDDADADDQRFADDDVNDDDMAFLDDDELMNNDNNFPNRSQKKKNPFTYVRVSFWAAVFLVYYAFRSRQQWYLALVFLSSSKYAYVILGNAFIASLIWCFQITTEYMLNGLRLNEAEGLSDYFRWHITETCLALTIFRSELNVKTFLLFLCLVFVKCLHYIVDTRESHLRMTEEIVVVNPSTGWISLRLPHVKLFAMITLLQILDVISVVMCAQDIMTNGPSVSILFAFESAIMLTSVISNNLLWNLHLLDGIFHFLHETSNAGSRMHTWIYPWKDHKATLVFAVELQAQAAKFLFYLTFFAIVMTYYGLPINLIREVYVSFLSLKQRLVAFNKYRQLMSSMNRFKSPTVEELEEEHTCIICRDEMNVETAKRLPGCGHIMHKSCLREWLVQQQTCPTCRGDISAMEARQKAQDVLNARIQERQQEQEQQEQEANKEETTEVETTQKDQSSTERTSDGEKTTDTARTLSDGIKETSTNDTNEPDRKKPAAAATTTSTQDKEIPSPVSTSPDDFVNNERPAFPAFYRVAQDTGASIYNDGVTVSFIVIRVVPCGVVFLGKEMDYRKCNGENRMMIKMPDGWVSDDDVERIVAVPFE